MGNADEGLYHTKSGLKLGQQRKKNFAAGVKWFGRGNQETDEYVKIILKFVIR